MIEAKKKTKVSVVNKPVLTATKALFLLMSVAKALTSSLLKIAISGLLIPTC